MSITHTAAGGDKNPQLIKANEETNDRIYHIPPHCCLLLLLHVPEFNVLMVLNTTGWLEVQLCSVSWLIVSQWTQRTLRVGGGALYHHHHRQICVFTESEAHLMSPKSFLFPAIATTMSSGPCSFSSFTHFFSVWKESWATRKTTQLWERLYV